MSKRRPDLESTEQDEAQGGPRARDDPDGLAGTLALLLEGALALGMPTLDPDNPRLAQAAARQIIQEALS